jgi:hypothetical protein
MWHTLSEPKTQVKRAAATGGIHRRLQKEASLKRDEKRICEERMHYKIAIASPFPRFF